MAPAELPHLKQPPAQGMVTYSFLGDLEGFKMGQYVGLLPLPVVVGLLHPSK